MAAIDLRPMTIGEVLDRTFKLYKSEFWLFAGVMSLPFLLLFVANLGVSIFSTGQITIARSGQMPTGFSPAVLVAAFGGIVLLGIMAFILVGIGQAATIFAVSDIYLGKPATIRGCFRQVRGHVLQALGTILLTALALFGSVLLLAIPIFLLARVSAWFVVLGILAIFVLIIALVCHLSLAVPAAMLEDVGPATALSRSVELSKGFGMQLFLILVLAVGLAIAVVGFISTPFSILMIVKAAKGGQLPIGYLVLQQAATFIGQVIVAPVQTIALSLMYYNLRVRKEGFDLDHLMGSLSEPSLTVLPAPGSAPL
jgi:hypothetical protein